MTETFLMLKGEISSRCETLSIDPAKAVKLTELARVTVLTGLRRHATVFSVQSVEKLLKADAPLEKNNVVHQLIWKYKRELVSSSVLNDRQAELISKTAIPFLFYLISQEIKKEPSTLTTFLTEEKKYASLFNKFRFWTSPPVS